MHYCMSIPIIITSIFTVIVLLHIDMCKSKPEQGGFVAWEGMGHPEATDQQSPKLSFALTVRGLGVLWAQRVVAQHPAL